MKIFLTGATGYIGSVIAEKLQAKGHQVLGLARSDEAEARLRQRGIEVQRGDLLDRAALQTGARQSDGVIHTAATMGPEMEQLDRAAVTAILEALASSGKPFVYTNGSLAYGDTGDHVVDESWPDNPPPFLVWRAAVEEEVLAAAAQNVRSVAIRPPLVYGRGGSALAAMIMAAAQEGVARHVGPGHNKWSTVHVDDLADLYVLALEKAPAGSRYNAAAGDAATLKEIAMDVSKTAGVDGNIQEMPVEEAAKTQGPFAYALLMNTQVSAAKARRELGWQPARPSLVTEITQGSYRRLLQQEEPQS